MSRPFTIFFPHRCANAWPAACALAAVLLLGAACAQDPPELRIAISSPSDGENVPVGTEIDFASSVKGGEKPVKLSWNFDSKDVGEVTPSSSSDKNPGGVVFSKPGKYKIVLSANDDARQEAKTSVVIEVSYEQFVRDFKATRGNEKITLTWTLPSDPDYQNVVIRRAEGSAPETVDDGDIIASELDPPDSDTSHVDGDVDNLDNPLVNETKYYYTIFAYKAGPKYGTGVSASATPKDTTPPAAPTGVTVTATGSSSTHIAWLDPTDDDFVDVIIPGHIEVRRSTASYPRTPADGDPACSGDIAPTIQTCDDSGLEADTVYKYTVFAFDEPEADNYSLPTADSIGFARTDE